MTVIILVSEAISLVRTQCCCLLWVFRDANLCWTIKSVQISSPMLENLSFGILETKLFRSANVEQFACDIQVAE